MTEHCKKSQIALECSINFLQVYNSVILIDLILRHNLHVGTQATIFTQPFQFWGYFKSWNLHLSISVNIDKTIAQCKWTIVALQRYAISSNDFINIASNFLVQSKIFRDHETAAILFLIISSFFKKIFHEKYFSKLRKQKWDFLLRRFGVV